MKRYRIFCTLLLSCLFLCSADALAYHSFNYYFVSQSDNMCTHCHPGGPHNHIPECIECHTASSPPYSVDVAPWKATHSSENVDSDKYGDWERECLDCHNPHEPNGVDRNGLSDPSYKLAEFTGLCEETVNGVTTMNISDITVYDPAWEDPSTWAAKTGPERGLVALIEVSGSTLMYKVVDASPSIVKLKNEHTYFPEGAQATPQHIMLVYGQFINNEVNGIAVKFGGPKTMANDESGSTTDPTPDGICQVCHTQTNHWRNDGTLANHFSGWRCTLCHPHEEGFKADPQPLCEVEEPPVVTVKQWNIDIQGDAGSTLYGQEGIAHPQGVNKEGVWNIFNVPPLDKDPATVVTDPSLGLVDNTGASTPVVFSIIGSVGGWSGVAPWPAASYIDDFDVTNDYIILLANHAFGYPDYFDFRFSGLEPGARYELVVRTSWVGERNMKTIVDSDGDGSIADESFVTTLGGSMTSSLDCVADANGQVIGRISTATTNEANPAGIILKQVQ